jgi:site-specific DNA-methyltransferase (adenine-specific)
MFRYEIIWEKERPTNFVQLNRMIGKVHESISIFYRQQPTYNPIKEKSIQQNNNKNMKSQVGVMNTVESSTITAKISKSYDNKTRFPRSVLKISRGTRKGTFHPTQKPVALMEYLIKTYTNVGETVLDFTMGSGTTGVACKNLNRNFIGIELDETYFNIAKERIDTTPITNEDNLK